MTIKKLYTITLSVVTLAIAAGLFTVGFRYSARGLAHTKMETEISALTANSKTLEEQKSEVTEKISNIQTELSTKSTVNNYFIEAKKINDDLKMSITDLKQQSSTLDADIETRKNELSASSTTKEVAGKKYTLKKGEIYTSPDKLPKGRYTASGSGSIIIYSSNSKVRVNENLDVAIGNSYTFDLDEKERVKVTGNVTLTELKQK